MTNALAATDEPLVHCGYARYRARDAEPGRGAARAQPGLGRAGRRRPANSAPSMGRLHAKLAVIDGRRLLVGSMNMDRRSARANTELGLLIDSPALAVEVSNPAARPRPAATACASAATTRRVEWVARKAGREVVHRARPTWAGRSGCGCR